MQNISHASELQRTPDEYRQDGFPPGAGVIVIVKSTDNESHYLFKQDFRKVLKASAGGSVEKGEGWTQAAIREANEELFHLLKNVLQGKVPGVSQKDFPSLEQIDPDLKFYTKNGIKQPLLLLPKITEKDIALENAHFASKEGSFAYATFIVRLSTPYSSEELKKIAESMSYLGSQCAPLYRKFKDQLPKIDKLNPGTDEYTKALEESTAILDDHTAENLIQIYNAYRAISPFTEASQFCFVPEKDVIEAVSQWKSDQNKDPKISGYEHPFFRHDCNILKNIQEIKEGVERLQAPKESSETPTQTFLPGYQNSVSKGDSTGTSRVQRFTINFQHDGSVVTSPYKP